MKKFTIYHNPRCSKSRQALALLTEDNQEPEVIEYLKTPLNINQIKTLLRKLGLKPRDIMRKNEEAYKTLGLANPELSDTALIQALSEYPILLERPIVVAGEKAVIARPPEKVKELI